jgi:hypothetical protein
MNSAAFKPVLISIVGGRLRSAPFIAGHTLHATEQYIEDSAKARRSIVDII